MHKSVMDFVEKEINEEDVFDNRVIELGSQDVNGSVRGIIEQRGSREYIGIDMQDGQGVDVVMDVRKALGHFGVESCDVVISTEMLEHVKDWKKVVPVIKGLCKRGGTIVVTTRSKGFPYHGYPDDYWRYSLESMKKIFGDFEIQVLITDPQYPGVMMKAKKPKNFVEVDLSGIEIEKV